MKKFLIILVVALQIFPVFAGAGEFTTDSLATVKANVESQKAVLVDVRELSEWNAGHIDLATSLPFSKISNLQENPDLFKALPKDKVIYLHCVAGVRAGKVAEILTKNGFQVRPLKPGYKELVSSGLKSSKQ